MSSRDELREALAEHFYVEVHGRSVASWSEVVVMENADRTWHIAAVYRAKADAVLAVFDQQGWVSADAHEQAVQIAEELRERLNAAEADRSVQGAWKARDERIRTLETERDAALREAASYEQVLEEIADWKDWAYSWPVGTFGARRDFALGNIGALARSAGRVTTAGEGS